MTFVQNWLIPLATMIIAILFVGGIHFFAWKFWKKLVPYAKQFWKYKVFRRPYKEKTVAWCMDAVSLGWDETAVQKFLLIKGRSKSEINDTLYIFKEVKKAMKGGQTK